LPYYVYILKCGDGSYYVRHTKDLPSRLHLHVAGFGTKYTKLMQPLTVAYSEQLSSQKGALRREKQLKSWSHAKKEALITGDFDKLKQLGRKNFKQE